VARFRPPPPTYRSLKARTFAGKIERDWRVSSFSSLTSGREELADLPDRDQESGSDVPLREEEKEGVELSIFDFPRGSAAGSCLHEIFERVDFSLFHPDETREIVADRLGRYGFGAGWMETICRLVLNTLSSPLGGEEGSFTLNMVRAGERLHELEFHTPLEMITAKELAGIFRSSGEGNGRSPADAIQRLGFKSIKGMLKGYIDMVFQQENRFYIVDWKSNHLGNSVEEYAPERLSGVMERELYVLQYHIYAVALDRFLSLRQAGYDYDRHFGGVFYLFLRGLNPEKPGCGVFFDRPARQTIERLTKYLIGG